MVAPGEDDFSRVKSAVDSWAAEVSQAGSALAQKLFVQMNTARPVFSLNAAAAAIEPAAPALSPSAPPDSRAADLAKEIRSVEAELEFARELLHDLNRNATASAKLAAEKSEQVEESARAVGRMRIELDEIREQLRARDWTLVQLKSENEMLRADGNSSPIPNVVPVDDYDHLASSHMQLRDEVAALQERLIQRDHELIALRDELAAVRAELAAWESTGPIAAPGIAKLAGVLAERSAALEEFEDTALGQKYLIGALRQELDAVRETLGRRELDHDRLARALRTELECLRAISTERDFVIGHQSQAIESVSYREQRLEAELAGAQDAIEALRRKADQSIEEAELINRDLQLTRAKLADREAELWKLRSAPAPAAPSQGIPGLAQLEAALAARDAELARARERIAFLRGNPREAVEQPTAAAPTYTTAASGLPAAAPDPAMNLEGIQVNSALQREVEHALSNRFSWPLIGVIGGIAGIGILLLGLLVLILI